MDQWGEAGASGRRRRSSERQQQVNTMAIGTQVATGIREGNGYERHKAWCYSLLDCEERIRQADKQLRCGGVHVRGHCT